MAKPKLPTVGSIVLYHPPVTDKTAFSNNHPGPVAAIVTRVWDDKTVNLKIVPDCGPMEDRASVVFDQKEYGWTWK